MSPSTAKLLRAVVGFEIRLREVERESCPRSDPINEEIAYLVRIIRKQIRPPYPIIQVHHAPTDLEIEQEIKAQLAERIAQAAQGL